MLLKFSVVVRGKDRHSLSRVSLLKMSGLTSSEFPLEQPNFTQGTLFLYSLNWFPYIKHDRSELAHPSRNQAECSLAD